jgi:hypothetical protein
VRTRIPVRIAKECEITTRFQNTVGLRGRVRVRPHSNLRADPRTAHQAGSSLQRGSNVTYFETGSVPHFPVSGFRLAAYRLRRLLS